MSDSQHNKKKKLISKKVKPQPRRVFSKKSASSEQKLRVVVFDNKKHPPKPVPPKKTPHNHISLGSRMQTWFAPYEVDLQVFLIPLILLVILVIISVLNQSVQSEVQSRSLPNFSSTILLNPYPVLSATVTPQISADSAIVMDDASKVVVYAKNPELRFSMASTTKIMSALVALSYYQPNSVLTIKRDYVEGSTAGFHKGDQLRFEDVLYGLLLPSGNDAAYALADNYPGGLNAFVAEINQKAQEWHLKSTHYADPAGLDDDNDYTVVTDLARLTSIALENPTFAKIVDTKEKIITTLNTGTTYDLLNLNKLLGTEGVTGVKTGTTEEAGQVLITSQVLHGHRFIIIVMRSDDRFADTQTLMNVVTSNVKYIDLESSQ